MTKHIIFLLVVISVLFISCKDDDPTEPVGIVLSQNDFILFGSYAGECPADCVTIYKITSENLSIALSTEYPFGTTYYESEYELLSQNKFEMSQDIVSNLPTQLLGQPSGEV